MGATDILLFLAGLALLIAGAELLVRGASRLAARVGMSSLVIGLTVVAFGTSAPELAVSVGAGLSGQGAMAAGNVIGSNVFNVLVILGASALVAPLVVAHKLVRWDVPVGIAAALAVWLLALDGAIGRIEGIGLFLALVVYLALEVRAARRLHVLTRDPGQRPRGGLLVAGVSVVAGLGMLILGTDAFVGGAVVLAQALGVSEAVIGLTIVAAGTSMPELFTSLVAAFRGERDIAVGNVVGSNLFNLLGILGIAAAVAPDGIPVGETARRVDLPVMVAAAVACLPVFFTGLRVARREGLLFLAGYGAYLAYLLVARAGP